MRLRIMFFLLTSIFSTLVFAQANTFIKQPSGCNNSCYFTLTGTKATADGLNNSFYMAVKSSVGIYNSVNNNFFYRREAVNSLNKLVLIENVEMIGTSISSASWRSTLYQSADLNNKSFSVIEVSVSAASTNDALNGANWSIKASNQVPAQEQQSCQYGYAGQQTCYSFVVNPAKTYSNLLATNQQSQLDFQRDSYGNFIANYLFSYGSTEELWNLTLSASTAFLKAFQPFRAVIFTEGGDAPPAYLNSLSPKN